MKLPFAPVLFALVAACGSPGATDGAELAPTPYTTEEIRSANPAGTERLFRIDSPGSPTLLRRMSFTATDADGATIEIRTSGLHGELVGRVAVQRSRWSELRDHGAFPADLTERTREACDVAAGKYECWKYVVQAGTNDEGVPVERRFWFADSKPGPPVLMEEECGGIRILRMELVEERRP